jgi:hypothetical protein
MSVDAWIFLWVGLLWGSSAAFLLVTLYILGGALKGVLAGKSGGGDD